MKIERGIPVKALYKEGGRREGKSFYQIMLAEHICNKCKSCKNIEVECWEKEGCSYEEKTGPIKLLPTQNDAILNRFEAELVSALGIPKEVLFAKQGQEE
jgi:hypothetical protein